MSHSTPVNRMSYWPDGTVEGENCDLFLIEGNSIVCRLCGHRSTNPQHVRNRFCPNCLTFFEDRNYIQRLEKGVRTSFEPRDANWHYLRAA